MKQDKVVLRCEDGAEASDNQINLLWMREIIERNGWKEV